MGVRGQVPFALVVGAFLVGAGAIRADSVKLEGGGSLSGSVSTGSKAVAVRTSSGALVVFDRTTVKQVVRGRTSPSKTATTASGSAASHTKKRKLTNDEDAWVSKVRALVSRLPGSDRQKAQQARNALFAIDDTDAIPALSGYLGSSSSGEARHLYVTILHNMKGPKPVYYLVALSLYDPSPQIRLEARQAIRDEQLESARLLYVAALRFGSPRLARVAAIAMGDIGDPRGESVPYLIDALVTYGSVASIRGAAQNDVFYARTIYSTPGLRVSDLNLSSMGQAGATSATPASDSSGHPNPQNVSTAAPGQSGASTPGATPSSSGQTNSGSGGFTVTSVEGDLYDPPKKCGKHDRPLTGYVDHPEVLDTLIKITDQPYPGYGFNQDRWRSWWANERTNRNLQNPPGSDRVLTAGSAAK
jgi:hypothetical protein